MGFGALPLYLPIGFVVYVCTLPTKFAGNVVQVITTVNLVTTWVVIIMAIVKGIHTVYTTPEDNRPPEFETWKPEGFMQVTVLLAGAMFQCGSVPRLQYEIKPELRQRASVMIPLLLAVVQGVVFLIIGTMGYWALGKCIRPDGNVFKSYFDVQPDWMVTVLQGGIATLMFLSIPLLSVAPKVELWTVLRPGKGHLDEQPLSVRMLINLVMVTYATLVPPIFGPTNLTFVVTVRAGIAANWINLFLPCFVNLLLNIVPARKAGEPWKANAAKSGWIFLLASLSFGSALLGIWGKIEPVFRSVVVTTTVAPGYCAELR